MELRLLVLISLLPAVFGLMPQNVSTRCECIKFMKFIHPKKFQNIEVTPQTSSCDKLEMIVTVNSKRICMDPNAEEGKAIISCWKRNERNIKKVKICLRRKLKNGKEKKKKARR